MKDGGFSKNTEMTNKQQKRHNLRLTRSCPKTLLDDNDENMFDDLDIDTQYIIKTLIDENTKVVSTHSIVLDLKYRMKNEIADMAYLVDDLCNYLLDLKEKHIKTNPIIRDYKMSLNEIIEVIFLRKCEVPKPAIIVNYKGEIIKLQYGGLLWRTFEQDKIYTIKNIGKKFRNKKDKIGYFDFEIVGLFEGFCSK